MRLCLFLLVVVGAHPAKSIPSARRERSSPPLASHISQLIGNLRREHATIAEIMEMSRQQRELQRAAEAARARRDWKYAPPRTIVVANRLPLSVKRDADGQLQYLMTGGGMVSALMGVRDVRMIWVGWCPVPDDITPVELEQVRRALLSRGCVPVFLPAEEASAYYNGFCNDELWPLFHYVIKTTPEAEDGAAEREQANWLAYKRVNERFADVVNSVARESDLVWVHDYHLMLLPSLLRAKRIENHQHIKIGWFLHTPWPSSEVFRTLARRREILVGLLAADLLGFHVYDYARHFLHTCTRLLGSEVSFHGRRLRWERPLSPAEGGGVATHSVKVDAFPIGIDPERFRFALHSNKVCERIFQLRQQHEGQLLLLGLYPQPMMRHGPRPPPSPARAAHASCASPHKKQESIGLTTPKVCTHSP
jgi:trehalose 6-phosphate synthase/phosphatase